MTLPGDDKRHLIIGRTGSGKTQAEVYALSFRSWDIMPWIVYNFKEDELINSIPGAIHLDEMKLPKKREPGIYIVHPAPDDYDGINAMMADAWQHGRTGICVDEGYMMAESIHRPSRWLRRVLTQGRSKRVPMIICTQRACQIDRFVFSETEFFQVFALSDKREVKTVHNFIDGSLDMATLPEYHSYWFDVPAYRLTMLRPVPDRDTILELFERRAVKIGTKDFI